MSAQFDSLPSAIAAPPPASFRADPFTLALVNVIREGLLRDQHVRLHQFGTFRLKWSKPSTRKHPTTGEPLHLPPQPRVYFTPAKHLRELIEPHPQPATPLPVASVTALSATSAASFPPRNKAEPAAAQQAENITHTDTTEAETEQTEAAKSRIDKRLVMGAGLLASVPLIVALLNAQFAAEQPVVTAQPPVNTVAAPTAQAAPVKTADASHPAIAARAIDSIRSEQQQNSQPDRQATPAETVRNRSTAKTASATHREEKIKPAEVKAFLNPRIHTIAEGDNLWRLAKQYFNNPLLWPYIYRANRSSLQNPNYLATGQSLVIPGLRQPASQLHGTDSTHIAEGYLLLYHYYQEKGDSHAYRYLIGASRFDAALVHQQQGTIQTADLQKALSSGKPSRLN